MVQLVKDGRPFGYFTEEECVAYAELVSKYPGGKFVEVGTFLGRSLSCILPFVVNNGCELTAVDLWPRDTFTIFNANMDALGFTNKFKTLRMASLAAAKLFDDRSLDFVFIDAAHDYESVKADILAWRPKVRLGGTLAGHDYIPNSNEFPGVLQAVNELCPVQCRGSIWITTI